MNRIHQKMSNSWKKSVDELQECLSQYSSLEEKHMRTRTYTDVFAEGAGTIGKFSTGAVMGSLGLPFAGASSDLTGWFWEREARNIAELAEILGTSLGHARDLCRRHQERVAVGLPPTMPQLA